MNRPLTGEIWRNGDGFNLHCVGQAVNGLYVFQRADNTLVIADTVDHFTIVEPALPAELYSYAPETQLLELVRDMKSVQTPRVEWNEDQMEMAKEAIRALLLDTHTFADRLVEMFHLQQSLNQDEL